MSETTNTDKVSANTRAIIWTLVIIFVGLPLLAGACMAVMN